MTVEEIKDQLNRAWISISIHTISLNNVRRTTRSGNTVLSRRTHNSLLIAREMAHCKRLQTLLQTLIALDNPTDEYFRLKLSGELDEFN